MNRARQIVAVILIMGGLLVASGLPNPLASPTAPTNARMRVGVVQASPAPQADYVFVLVDGTVVQAAFFTGYIPIAGDRVTVTQDGTDWFVVGGKAGYAGNLIVNPGFAGRFSFSGPFVPYTWSWYLASGAGQVSSFVGTSGVSAGDVLAVAAGDNYVVSAAFPVAAGQSIDCLALAHVLSATSVTFQLRLAWFVDGQSAYPNTAQADTVVAAQTVTVAGQDYVLASAATVPTGATYARMALRMSSANLYEFYLHQAQCYR